jgi:hypothetical protein
MHYFFLDESYRLVSGQKNIIFSSWAVEQHKWRSTTASAFDLFKPPIFERVYSMFESLDASASLARAALDPSFYRPAQIDATTDIPKMSRTDTVWATAAVFALVSLMAEIMLRDQQISLVDIHYDNKTLPLAAHKSLELILRERIPDTGKPILTARGFGYLIKNLNVRRIVPVSKENHLGAIQDKFTMGTWVADKMCPHIEEIESGKFRNRIGFSDISGEIRRTAQRFDGKSYYE